MKMNVRLKRLAMLTAVAAIATTGTPLSAQAPTSGQAWRDATQRPEVRAAQLLAAMSREQKIALVNAVDPAEYASLAPLGIPALRRVDASSGLRGDVGQTAFPVPLALAATFDAELARSYGMAIADEARGKGWNVILGPTVDVARDGLSGRLSEAYGEDPWVSAVMGSAVAAGMQSRGVLAIGKHFTAYQSERDRQRMNVNVSDRALHEVYNPPFYALIDKARIGGLMGAYPKINGTFALENKAVIEQAKAEAGFKGFMVTDLMGGADAVAQFNAGMDSWSFQPYLRQPDALRDGRIPPARLDDAVERTLWALFSTGLFDRPVLATPAAVVSTPEHQALALRTATQAMVLLKNDGKLLPLSRSGRIAVIGPVGKDVVTGVMWSSYVDPGQFTTPIEAIASAAGRGVKIVQSQGTLGDTTLPNFGVNGGLFAPPVALTAPDGGPGWGVEYFANDKWAGTANRSEVVKDIDVTGTPLPGSSGPWSARWQGRFIPFADGPVRLAASLSGTVKVKVGGKVVIDGMRSTASNFPGGGPSTYPLQGVVPLKAHEPVDVTVEYSTAGAVIGQRMQLGWQAASAIPAAVEAARHSDVAVVFVNQVTGEEMDRDHYALPGDQDALIDAVSAANPNTVVVLNTGGAVKMPWLPKVKSVLQMWYPGMASGTAVAQVLFGDAEPGGRLPITFPADESQGPRPYAGGMSMDFTEDVSVGHAYYQKHRQQPLFPFGFGLSFAQFGLNDLHSRALAQGEDLTQVSIRVVNESRRKGSTVVQLYAGKLPGQVDTPVSKLLGFARVALEGGEERVLTIPVERRSLSYWDSATRQWVTPSGSVPVRVGFSSEGATVRGEIVVK
ncbi:glycoside hydrolase family 3 protein [Roseateles koreensis]|uniref:Glycoside hydrolase family 3 C-terminal domain-containing protein n=1 Tax=Roseateles koreensis TaxID=2987526 RepID=A0ABT5KQC8_9BURK|nr:glycoside hydrolase family 3 C-terminal domain-containing protein [Roseateles koreensis]MDC8784675.1 glycoside hydrolase family 3 C-terminal domain-containing protein [Roseateles koreensis]